MNESRIRQEPLPFLPEGRTTRWDFDDGYGSYLQLEEYDEGWLFGGKIKGIDIHDENYEDYCFRNYNELYKFFKKHNLLGLLTSLRGEKHDWLKEGF